MLFESVCLLLSRLDWTDLRAEYSVGLFGMYLHVNLTAVKIFIRKKTTFVPSALHVTSSSLHRFITN